MTSTPTSDRNVTALIGAKTAEDTGTESAPAGHDEATPGRAAGAKGPQDTGRAQRLVWLDPAGLAVHPRNVRDDLGDLSGLAASIAAQGVLEALTVVPITDPDGTPGHQLVAGHRRAAAAILAGVTPVPCVLRDDLALDGGTGGGDRAGQARHVAAMLAENLHRQGLSAVEEARGVQTMLDLGESITKVAASTGLGRKRVAKAACIARLDARTAAAVTASGLTLDQAASVAVYADDPDTAATLIEAAEQGPGRFAHALTRAKQARVEAEQLARLAAELAAAGRTVLDDADSERATPIRSLAHDGRPLTAETHADCPGSAVWLTSGWGAPRVVEVCTDPVVHGHTIRWADNSPHGSDRTEPPEDERNAAAAARRREIIENNKAMAAANQTRRDWVRALLQRRIAPKAGLRFAVDTLAADPRTVARWLSGQPNTAQEQTAAALGLTAPGQWQPDGAEPAPTLTSGEQLPDARLTVALLAHVAAAIESGIDRHTWRNPSRCDARWLRYLAETGYTLADIEQQVIAAATPTGGEDADDAMLGNTESDPGGDA